jgi:hypothetical protein
MVFPTFCMIFSLSVRSGGFFLTPGWPSAKSRALEIDHRMCPTFVGGCGASEHPADELIAAMVDEISISMDLWAIQLTASHTD